MQRTLEHNELSPAALRQQEDRSEWRSMTDLADLVEVACHPNTDRTTALNATIRAATAIDFVCAASIVLRHGDGKPKILVATNPWAEEMDQLQLRCNESPYADLQRSGTNTLDCSDLRTAVVRWPAFVQAAARNGLGSLMIRDCSPVSQEGQRAIHGVLNLYSLQRDRFTAEAASLSTLLARVTQMTLGLHEAKDNLNQVRDALETRDAIGCAKGVLMERHGFSSDAAFSHLRRVSNRLNVKLAAIASLIMEDPSWSPDI